MPGKHTSAFLVPQARGDVRVGGARARLHILLLQFEQTHSVQSAVRDLTGDYEAAAARPTVCVYTERLTMRVSLHGIL
jgi:hypothetical protein